MEWLIVRHKFKRNYMSVGAVVEWNELCKFKRRYFVLFWAVLEWLFVCIEYERHKLSLRSILERKLLCNPARFGGSCVRMHQFGRNMGRIFVPIPEFNDTIYAIVSVRPVLEWVNVRRKLNTYPCTLALTISRTDTLSLTIRKHGSCSRMCERRRHMGRIIVPDAWKHAFSRS